MTAQGAALSAVHEELLKKATVDEVKRAADNERYAREIRDLMHGVAEDVRRTVAQSEALKAMDAEQAARVHALYFKTHIANRITQANESGAGPDDPMLAVREDLLREVAQKEVSMAAEDEKMRRTIEEFKHTVSDAVRRTVAQNQARAATELEQAQRVTIDKLHAIGEELRRTVAKQQADAAVDVERAQRIQADYFKRMVAGHIANNQELASANPSLKAVQAQLLAEVAPVN